MSSRLPEASLHPEVSKNVADAEGEFGKRTAQIGLTKLAGYTAAVKKRFLLLFFFLPLHRENEGVKKQTKT